MTSFKPEGTAAALMDDFVNGILRRVDRHIAEGLPPLGSTVASYERISDDREGKELGVARQREDTTELAAQDGHTIPEQAKFQDNDLGASTRSRKPRPDFERLMAYVISGQVKVVYAYSNSRLTRRPMELELLIRVADRAGVQYRTKASGSDDLATADGRMVARIKAAVDAAEAERTGERVARTHLQSAQAGKAVGGNRPFGFKRDKMEHDPAEVAVLKRVVDDILGGATVRDAVAYLNNTGVKTTTGREWTPQTLKQVLRSPRLAGWRVYQKQIAQSPDGKPVRGQWNPILDQDVWDRLQLRVTSEPDTRNRVPRRDARHYLLTGLVRCGICNGPLYGNAHTAGKFYYVCSPSQLPTGHGLSGSGLAIDRIVTAQVLLRLQDIDATVRADAAPWPGEARSRQIAEMKLDAMQQLRDGSLSAQVVFPHVQALEVEEAELEAERVEYLDATHLTQKGPVTPEQWEELSTGQRRAYLDALLTAVIVKPSTRGGNSFDPTRLVFVWRESFAPVPKPQQ